MTAGRLETEESRGLRAMAPIHEAVKRGDLAEVERLVEADPGAVHAKDCRDLKLPLVYAAHGGHVAVVAYLLDQGAAINQRGGAACTALHLACEHGHGEVVRLLLARGADPTLADRAGYTPLMCACILGHIGVVRSLLTDGTSPIDAVNHACRTALFYAAGHGHAKVVRLLLRAGADPTTADEDGRTALSTAREKNRQDIVAVLEVRNVI